MKIEVEEFEKLCGLQCTETEIAEFFGCGVSTLTRWCQREYGKRFEDIFKEKRAQGKKSLRRMQWKLAEKSPAMAIFLGKNYLNQRDEQNIEISGEIPKTLAELMLEGYSGKDKDEKSPKVPS